MTFKLSRSALLSLEGLLLGTLYLLAWWAVTSPFFEIAPSALGAAILIDLTLTAGLIHYLFAVRGAKLPGWTVFPVAAMGYTLTGVLTPDPSLQRSMIFLFAAAVVELSVVVVILMRISELVGGYRRARRMTPDSWKAFELSLSDVLGYPRLAKAVRMECELLFLAGLGWFRRPEIRAQAKAFTVHKLASWFPLVGALIFLSLAEFGLLHYFLVKAGWTGTAVLSLGAHAYGLLWLLGDAQALRLRPIVVSPARILIRIGLRWGCSFSPDQVLGVEQVTRASEDGFPLVLLGSPNIALSLREEIEIEGLFGIRRRADLLLLQVDDPGGFLAAMEDVTSS